MALLPWALLGIAATSALRFLPPLRTTADRIQSVLSATIGDSYAFVAGLSGHAAIVQQVRRDIEWMLEQGVTRLVVAAHSQGAAVTYEALARWECTRVGDERVACGCHDQVVDLLTYGSGLDRLTALSSKNGRRLGVASALGLIIASIAGASGLVLLVAAPIVALLGREGDTASLAVIIAAASLALVGVMLTFWTITIFFRFWLHIPLVTLFGETYPRALSVELHTAPVGPSPLPCRVSGESRGEGGPVQRDPDRARPRRDTEHHRRPTTD